MDYIQGTHNNILAVSATEQMDKKKTVAVVGVCITLGIILIAAAILVPLFLRRRRRIRREARRVSPVQYGEVWRAALVTSHSMRKPLPDLPRLPKLSASGSLLKPEDEQPLIPSRYNGDGRVIRPLPQAPLISRIFPSSPGAASVLTDAGQPIPPPYTSQRSSSIRGNPPARHSSVNTAAPHLDSKK